MDVTEKYGTLFPAEANLKVPKTGETTTTCYEQTCGTSLIFNITKQLIPLPM